MDETDRRPARAIFFPLFTVLIAVVIVLAVLELALRRLPPRLPPQADRSSVFFRAQPEREHPWADRDAPALRVAIVGDSFTAGAGCQPDDSYGARLERLLNMNAGVRPARVEVFARSRTSTYEHVKLVRTAMETKPDILIPGMCLNDTEDWCNPAQLMTWRDMTMPGPPPAWLASLIRPSRALQWIYRRSEQRRANALFLRYYENIYHPNYSGWKRLVRALPQIRDICRAGGAEFVGVLFPLMSHDLRADRYPLLCMHERIRSVYAANGMRFLDLLPAFTGLSPERMQAVPMVDPHPSEIGHRIASEQILRYLLDEGIVRKAYEPRQHWATDQHKLWERILKAYDSPGDHAR